MVDSQTYMEVLRRNVWRRTVGYCKSTQQSVDIDSEQDGCQGGIPHEMQLEGDLDDNANTTSCKMMLLRRWQIRQMLGWTQ